MEHMITEVALARMHDLQVEADHDRLVHLARPRGGGARAQHRQSGSRSLARRMLAPR